MDANTVQRGAKFTILSVEKIFEILNLKQGAIGINKIITASKKFESHLHFRESSRVIITTKTLTSHISENELTDKSLASLICYVFSSCENPDIIESRLTQLFENIQKTEDKSDSLKKINEVIKTNIKEKKKVKTVNPQVFPIDWRITVNNQWQVDISPHKSFFNNIETIIYNYKYRIWMLISLCITVVVISFIYLLIVNDNNNVDPFAGPLISDTKIEECVFKNHNSKYKILIVPFQSTIKVNNVEKDIGAIIEERLDNINKRDSLNLNIHYCRDFKYDKKISDGDDSDYYRRIMEEYNADHIIYGKAQDIYSEEDLGATKVRLNYCTRLKENLESTLSCDSQFDYRLISLANIFNGELLENMEYLIYWNTALGMYDKSDNKKTLHYLNLITDSLKIKNRDILTFRAVNQMDLGKYDDALNDINVIISDYTSPDKISESYNMRAVVKLLKHDLSAIDDLEKIVDMGTKSSHVYHNIGYFRWYAEKDAEKAMKAYDEAYFLSESNEMKAQTLNSKGMILYSLGRYIEALEQSESAISLFPEGYCYWHNKATNLYALGRIDEAFVAIEKSIVLNPVYYSSYDWRGFINEAMGLKAQAVNDYIKSLELFPFYEGNDQAFSFLIKLGEYDVALEIVNKALKIYPRDYLILNKRQYVYRLMECDDLAIKDQTLMEKISPSVQYYVDSNDIVYDIVPMYDSLSKEKPKRTIIRMVD